MASWKRTHVSSVTCAKCHLELKVGSTSEVAEGSLCPLIDIEQDDLPVLDIISQFRLDTASPENGVYKVAGSTPLQVAYRLNKEMNFNVPTSISFPNGFPLEYSFVATFRMIGSTIEKNWNIWQIKDPFGNDQVGVRINGETKSVEFYVLGLEGRLQTITFSPIPILFDSEWHKVLISVETDTIVLFIDCKRFEMQPINPKGIVSTEGGTFIGKLNDSPRISVPFELQWMIIHCDPHRAQRESCPELPVRNWE
ncbi:collagen alpha-1(IX) chain-like [Heptranchias perlo]|uniref:collagen alpha-1(IX) chain-like n=1 Tax=Heptranchias perlo TaxID=212740 RepID=UPI00355A3795